ncbi:hypothetical protein [Haloarchaeobius sp. DFWS5]|uniref:hypothetical protein n=1 Tax=Haloarchaeobius sp. DFWS5 TaxID=3446114 RepID=UPI003EBA12A7
MTPTDEEIKNAIETATSAVETGEADALERSGLRLVNLARRKRRETRIDRAEAE